MFFMFLKQELNQKGAVTILRLDFYYKIFAHFKYRHMLWGTHHRYSALHHELVGKNAYSSARSMY